LSYFVEDWDYDYDEDDDDGDEEFGVLAGDTSNKATP